MGHEFSDEEISAVKTVFPTLELVDPAAWQGTFDLNATFNDYAIRDSYEISIAIPEGYPDEIPALYVRGGRLQKIISEHRLTDIKDLHTNATGSACVCVKQEEKVRFPPGSSFIDFMNNLVTPYLYGLSYFDENGRWPWGEYAHGSLGLLEAYAIDAGREKTEEDIQLVAPIIRNEKDKWKEYRKQFMSPNPNRMCPCGKNQPIAKCHPLAWEGLVSMKQDIKRLGLNSYKLFSRM